jgi:voltage-gated potassium channel
VSTASADQAGLSAYQRFRNAVEWPMLGLSILFLVVVVLPAATPLSDGARDALGAVELLIWGAFALEIVILFVLAPSKRRMLRDHWLDVFIVAAPFLRVLRIARIARVLRAGTALGRAVTALQRITARRGTQAFGGVAVGLVVIGGLGAWAFERQHPEASIDGFADAMWWSVVTTTTVGYGDVFPVTAEGRALAVVLMLTGIGLIGTVSANVAAYFVRADETEDSQHIAERLDRLENKLDELIAEQRRKQRP